MDMTTVYPQEEKHFHKDYSKEAIKHESKVNMSLSFIGSYSCHQPERGHHLPLPIPCSLEIKQLLVLAANV